MLNRLALIMVVALGMIQGGALAGPVVGNDGSFGYQGYLEFEGAPANGDFYFRFSMFDSAVGGNEVSPLYSEVGPITATDGLFVCNIQMGDTQEDALGFWKEYGDAVKYLNIEVGQIEGSYTTLSDRVFIGSTAQALHSQFARALTFPYVDSYSEPFGDPSTMLSLTSEFGGTVAELRANGVSDEPTVYIRGEEVFGSSFAFQSGALLVDSREDEVAIRGEGSRFSIVGFFSDPPTLSGVSAAVVGSVGFGSSADVVAVWGTNGPAGTSARLGTADYAGDFDGDVLARDALRVQGEATRDYASNSPSPIGPLAYGFVSTTGVVGSATANFSASWDAANSRYIIEVDGEFLGFNSHVVSVTVVDSFEPRLATFDGAGSGMLSVKIWDINSGNVPVQDNFSIVIYDANPVVVNRIAAPDGVDADKYTEATGAVLVETRSRVEPVAELDTEGLLLDD
tara:strand:- start:132476 stop:133837 length:1362 start_codon:yes stop_codon:yes gene_type:complete